MDDSYTPSERRGYRRVVIGAILLFSALALLPLIAGAMGEQQEDWILPVFVVVMAAVGAVMWTFIPAVMEGTSGTGRRVLVGACAGLAAAAASMFTFFALLSGFAGS